MSSSAARLPTRFPVGTRLVIEGHGGRIRLRYLEFPNGRHVDLPVQTSARSPSRRRGARARTSSRK